MITSDMESSTHHISQDKLKKFNAENIAPSRTSSWEAEVAGIKRTPTAIKDDEETQTECNFSVTAISEILSVAAATDSAEAMFDDTDTRKNLHLAKELSAWIVGNAREQYRNLSSQGHRKRAVQALKNALDALQQPTYQNDDFVRLHQVDLMLDLGQKNDAQSLLFTCAEHLLPRLQPYNLSKEDIDWQRSRDMAFRENLKADQAELAKQLLDRSIRAGAGKEANHAIDSLRRTEPQYLDIETPMELFDKCRQISRLGAQKETEAETDPTNARDHLTMALKIYSQGCQTIEVSHIQNDSPLQRVWRHDHVDCAQLFFAAARVCITFKTLALRTHDGLLMPKHLNVPHMVTQSSWELQALRFLELGRARALRDTLERNKKLDEKIMSDESVPELEDDDSISQTSSSSSADQSADRTPIVGPEPVIINVDDVRLLEESIVSTLDNAADKLATINRLAPYKKTIDRWSKARKIISSRLRTDVNLQEMQASIPAGTVVIEYALISLPPKRGLITLVVTPEDVFIPRVVDLNEEVQSLLDCLDYEVHVARYGGSTNELSNRGYKHNGATLLKEVRMKLVDPLKDFLFGCQRLILVPSGELANVPWTLVFDKPACVLPSLFVWSSLHGKNQRGLKQDPRTLFLASKPNDSYGNAKNNQYARLEALSLAYFHTADNKHRPQLADELDLEGLKNLFQDKELVHVCAHSTFNKTLPMGSSVDLTAQPLTVWDWYDLDVRARLVIFSSCLSAFSRTAFSGQSFGFSYAMLSTGTDAFIGSLWRVNDKMTFLFMLVFYEHLLRGHNPADALFLSQKGFQELDSNRLRMYVQMLHDMKESLGFKITRQYVSEITRIIDDLENISSEELKNPAHWAPFILVGHGFRSIGY